MKLEQAFGAALMLLFLADVFLTVLYARAGTGLFAPYWDRAIWSVFRAVSHLFGKWREAVLSLAGPVIIVSLIGLWALGLTVGAALMIQPELGTAVRPSTGDSPTDFITALLVAGDSLSIVGAGDYSPHTSGTRLLFLMNSLVGASVLSLVLSYLVQVYSALRERNALALTIDMMTDGTGNAAEMLARLGAGGDFNNAVSTLGNLVQPLAATKEAHHFYPLLYYFRFTESRYSVSRLSFILLDLMTLIETTLDWQKHAALVHSAPVNSLRRCALLLLQTLDHHFPTEHDQPVVTRAHVYEASYAAASATLRRAGVQVHPHGARYVEQRSHWEPLIRRVGPALGYEMDEIDCRAMAEGTMSQARSAG